MNEQERVGKEEQNKLKENAKKSNVICFSEVEAQEVEWLWAQYIPKGKITIIQGDPGSGKTYLTAYIASVVSNGKKFPYTEQDILPGNVILQNGEDDINDTLKPRLNKVMANCNNVYIIDETSEKTFKLQDIDTLRDILEKIKPALVIIDPIQQYIGDIDMNGANKVRNVLAPIKKIAEEFNCAILIVMHMNKGNSKALFRTLGSIDMVGIARSMLTIGINPQNPNEKIISQTKSSNGSIATSIAFTINDDGIEWLGVREALTSDDIINVEYTKPRVEAREFLTNELSNGSKLSTEIEEAAKTKGISSATLNRVKKAMRISSYQKDNAWYWKLNN